MGFFSLLFLFMSTSFASWNSYAESDRLDIGTIARGKRIDTAEDWADLVDAIRGVASSVKALLLGGNTYSEEACQAISEVLKECAQLEYLDGSDMFTTRLKTAVPPALCHLCQGVASLPLIHLDVSDNALGGPGTAAVMELLPKETFRVLRLNNGGIGTVGALELANRFRNMAGVASVVKEDAKHEDLVQILEDHPSEAWLTEARGPIPLEVLIVGRNRFKADGAEALSYGLSHLSNLREFHAPSNSIPAEGLIQICEALKACPKLEVINVNDNTLKQKGLAVLIPMVEQLPNLRELHVGDCSLEAEGCLTLLRSLKDHASQLERLDMSYNEMDDEGCDLLLELLAARPTLQSLELNGSCLSGTALKKLHAALESHPHSDVLGSMSDNEDEEDEDEDDGDDAEEDDVDSLADGVSKLSV